MITRTRKSVLRNLRSKSPLREIKKLTKKRKYTLESKLSLQSPNKRLVKYLNMICSDSCGCLVFARENEKVKALFNGYKNFDSSKSPYAYKRGTKSVNGFVYEIELNKGGYQSSVLLKSSIKKGSDNLFYEYLVGIHFINEMNNIYPCFTETYHIMRNESTSLKEEMIGSTKVLTKDINESFQVLNGNINEGIRISCDSSNELAILVQYIKNPITFMDYTLNYKHILMNRRPRLRARTIYQMKQDAEHNNKLAQLLFQIYGPLTQIKDSYTHYDLHGQNVLLYNMKKGTYIIMNYVYKNTTVTFKTNMITKIIDYGRSYFKTSRIDSSKIKEMVCLEKQCNKESPKVPGVIIDVTSLTAETAVDNSMEGYVTPPAMRRSSVKSNKSGGYSVSEKYLYENEECGYDVGYKHLRLKGSIRPNISQDLRLAFQTRNSISANTELGKLLKKIVYKNEYGTPEAVNSEPHPEILNIPELEKALKDLIIDKNYGNINDNIYVNDDCIGTLTIYMDEDELMNFNPL